VLNGFDQEFMPILVPGKLAPEDLERLGSFIQKIAGAGFILTDTDTEDHLRELAGLPAGTGMIEDEVVFDNGEEEVGPAKKPVKPIPPKGEAE
jgi:hypothetical protein